MSTGRFRRVVLASDNAGKLREMQALLGGVDLLPQGELGIEGAEETAVTFVENALLKARHAARESGLAAIADDSGLVVRALGGAPGVWSARYAGEPKSDAANNAKLIAALRGASDRSAHFHCTLVLLHSAEDPDPVIVSRAWHGVVVDQPRGSNGFGYDPHFLLESRGCTAAELDAATKNALSHRGQACRALAELLAERGEP
ncbi:MAG: RdgB/HAM1 family non-canonical purine NTP pyrophosphatase [Gammaproteobacteria bacterium]|nr:RdgB/HAM1 family non-canonical purine NTP pyrophosphatase [Gammaproteobacteria bacterium]